MRLRIYAFELDKSLIKAVKDAPSSAINASYEKANDFREIFCSIHEYSPNRNGAT